MAESEIPWKLNEKNATALRWITCFTSKPCR